MSVEKPRVFPLVLGVGFLLPLLSFGQPNPDFVLSLTDGSGPPGSMIEVESQLTFTGTAEVAGWEFGVCHDSSVVEIVDVVPGVTTLTANSGQPAQFMHLEIRR